MTTFLAALQGLRRKGLTSHGALSVLGVVGAASSFPLGGALGLAHCSLYDGLGTLKDKESLEFISSPQDGEDIKYLWNGFGCYFAFGEIIFKFNFCLLLSLICSLRNLISNSMKAKIIAYVTILALHINDFQIDLTLLQRDLKLSEKR